MKYEESHLIKPGDIVEYKNTIAHFIGKVTKNNYGIYFKPLEVIHTNGFYKPIDWGTKDWNQTEHMKILNSNQETKLENFTLIAKNKKKIECSIRKI